MPKAVPRQFASFLLFAALLFAASAGWADESQAVAKLGATQYSAADLNAFVQSLDPATRREALADPETMNRLVQLEIIRKAILAEAKAKNWQKRPDVAKAITAAADAITLKDYLASAVPLPAGYPSPEDIQKAYDLNRDRFMQPRQYHLEQIFIASPRGDKNAAAAQKKVDDMAAKLRAGAKFEDLARAGSDHKPSAAKGGDMGWAPEDQILPEIRATIAGMTKGEISAPIGGDAGWHIIRMLDTKPAAPRPLAEVTPLIIASLRQNKQQQDEQLYIVQMLQKTPVTLDRAAVRKAFAAGR
jgi:peptidylprolyl isomerase